MPSGMPCCLDLHRDWAGPVKALDTEEGRIQRIDLHGAFDVTDPTIDEEGALAAERLMQRLNARAEDWFAGKASIHGWTPPPAKTLRTWLVEAGCEAAIDGEDHLRCTLKRRGCDGQVRVFRDEGRLRFTMPLAQGRGLVFKTYAAMSKLALEANARCKLARIARMKEKAAVRFEAQVDLSGLPWLDDRPTIALWKGMISRTALSLELALRRLGLELPLLAQAGHPELFHWILKRTTPARGI
jgi:hypothetical protein